MPNENQLENKTGEVIAKSLDELEKSRLESVIENLVTLVDISGSMDGIFKADRKKRKIDAAQKALTGLWKKTHWDLCEFQVFAFDTEADILECSQETPPKLPDIRGGTNFSSPLDSALEKNPTRIILCSDGQAEYPEKQVRKCQELGIPVDTIYIEGDDYDAEECKAKLQRISDETSGQFTTVDNAEDLASVFAQLETTERLLLTDQSSDDPIEL